MVPPVSKSQPYRIRPAVPADAPAIAETHIAALREAYGGLMAEDHLTKLSLSERIQEWSRILRYAKRPYLSAALVAEHGPDVVGFAACGKQQSETLAERGYGGEFSALYLLVPWQRRGIGTALMGAMSQAMQEDGFRAASLWVFRDNGKARRFYEHLGGHLLDERASRYGEETMAEVAYGWPDLAALRQRARGS